MRRAAGEPRASPAGPRGRRRACGAVQADAHSQRLLQCQRRRTRTRQRAAARPQSLLVRDAGRPGGSARWPVRCSLDMCRRTRQLTPPRRTKSLLETQRCCVCGLTGRTRCMDDVNACGRGDRGERRRETQSETTTDMARPNVSASHGRVAAASRGVSAVRWRGCGRVPVTCE